MAKESLKVKLSEILREALGQRASAELLRAIDPQILDNIRDGAKFPTVAELVVAKVIRLAVDPKKPAQWAVELIFDRTEGRAVQGAPPSDGGRRIEEKLDAITAEHLNDLAAQFARSAPDELKVGADAAPKPDGPASKLLDLRGNRPRGPEGKGVQPAVAQGASPARGK